jgi:hypothetical protein
MKGENPHKIQAQPLAIIIFMRKLTVLLFILFSFTYSSAQWNDYLSMNLYGKVESIIENEYDKNGELKVTKKYYFNNSSFIDSTVFIYGELFLKTKTIYNKQNRIQRQLNNSTVGAFNHEYYNLDNETDSLVNIDANGNINAFGKIYYNENYRPIKSVIFSSNGDTNYIDKQTYDMKGRLIEDYFESKDTSIGKSLHKFFYDSTGIMKGYSVLKNGKLTNNEIFEYEFDSKNNWIIKTVFYINGELKMTVKREITYK